MTILINKKETFKTVVGCTDGRTDLCTDGRTHRPKDARVNASAARSTEGWHSSIYPLTTSFLQGIITVCFNNNWTRVALVKTSMHVCHFDCQKCKD